MLKHQVLKVGIVPAAWPRPAGTGSLLQVYITPRRQLAPPRAALSREFARFLGYKCPTCSSAKGRKSCVLQASCPWPAASSSMPRVHMTARRQEWPLRRFMGTMQGGVGLGATGSRGVARFSMSYRSPCRPLWPGRIYSHQYTTATIWAVHTASKASKPAARVLTRFR